jgi:serine phosphatase RsbU (regulator of sigma subunit)
MGTIYPSWSAFLWRFLPEEFDDPAGRVSLGALAWVGLGICRWSRRAGQHAALVAGAVALAMAVHFLILCHEAQLSVVYVIGALVFTAAVNAVFPTIVGICIFSAVMLGGSVVIALIGDGALPVRLMLCAGILTIQVIAITTLAARLRMARLYEAERLRSLALEQQVITEQKRAAEAEKEHLMAQMEAARLVQSALLPVALEEEAVEVVPYYRAADQTGGDWYGWHRAEGSDDIDFYISDVTGHGISSALLTGVLCGGVSIAGEMFDRGDASARLPTDSRLLRLAEAANTLVHRIGSRSDRFVTMVFLSLNVGTGKVSFVNAGHTPVVVVSREARGVRTVFNPGDVLGYTTSPQLKVASFQLEPGDSFMLFTDGLIENTGAEGGKISMRDLKDLLARAPAPESLKGELEALTLSKWKDQSLDDDVSFLYVYYRGQGR